MRSRLAVWGYLVVLSLGTMLNLYMPKTEAAAKESIVIPGEAIRLRILANSDFEKDQAIKRKVRDEVNAQITLWVQDLTSMQEAKTVMTEKLPEIQAIAEKVVREQGSKQSVKVEFGKVQFPTKLYGQFLYPAGEYQAILITLGKGEGANWWCVLYPPLCFLDFSNGVAVSEGFEEEKQVAKAETVSGKEAAAELKADKSEPKEDVKPADEDAESASKEEELADKDVKLEEKDVEPATEKTVKEVTAAAGDIDGEKAESEDSDHSKISNNSPVMDEQAASVNKSSEVKKAKKKSGTDAPVYTAEDEEPVKVKFFVVEMWEKIFH